MNPPPPPIQFNVAGLTEARRITLDAESVLVERQATVGGFQPGEEIFWDEVRALYTWEAPHWGLIVGGSATLAVGGGLAVMMTRAIAPPWLPSLAVVLVLASIALVVFLAARVMPAQWFRLETTRGPIEFATRYPGVLETLLSRSTLETGAPGGPPA